MGWFNVLSQGSIPLGSGRSAEVLEREEQSIAKRRVQLVVANAADDAHGIAELLQVILAAVALHQGFVDDHVIHRLPVGRGPAGRR
jgi:hypothetical protein